MRFGTPPNKGRLFLLVDRRIVWHAGCVASDPTADFNN